MPKVLEIEGYQFYFYSYEGNEPPHVHVRKAGNEAKFWLEPHVRLHENYGYKVQGLRKAWNHVAENRKYLIAIYNEWHKR